MNLIIADILEVAVVLVALAAVAAVGTVPNDNGDVLLMHFAKLRYAVGFGEAFVAAVCILAVIVLYTVSGGTRIVGFALAAAGIVCHIAAERIAYTPISRDDRKAVAS